MKQQENLTPVPDEAIIRQYADMVYRLAYAQTRSKSDADDIFQEVFLRYIQRNNVALPHSDYTLFPCRNIR